MSVPSEGQIPGGIQIDVRFAKIQNDIVTACGFIILIGGYILQNANVLHIPTSIMTAVGFVVGLSTLILGRALPNPPTPAQKQAIITEYKAVQPTNPQ